MKKYLGFLVGIFAVSLTVWAVDPHGFSDIIVRGSAHIGAAGAANSKAVLELTSTTKGFLPPRMTSTQKGAIASPVEAEIIYDTTNHIPWQYNGSGWVATGVPLASVGNTGYVLKSGGGSTVNAWSNALDSFALTNINANYGTASDANELVLPTNTTTNLATQTNTAGKIAYDSTQSKPVFNNGSGWTTIGTGSGGGTTNWITNSDAESGTSGWSTYADAAGTSPVDGTGGSPTVTWTQTSSSPLSGTNSFLLTHPASNTQGQGVSFDFTIDKANEGRSQKIYFDYAVASGTFTAGSLLTDSDVEVWIYDKTNGVLIQPSIFKLYSNSTLSAPYSATFQASSNSTSYRLILHTESTSTSAFTLQVDNVSVSPQNYFFGTPITDWASFTPTTTNITVGNGTQTAYWRRVGDSIEIEYNLLLGTTSAIGSGPTVSLPSGYSIDTSKLQSGAEPTFGVATAVQTGTKTYTGLVVWGSTTSVAVRVNGTGDTITSTNPFTWASGHKLNLLFKVPALGVSASTQMSDNASQGPVAFFASSSATTSITSSVATKVTGFSAQTDTKNQWNSANSWWVASSYGQYRIYGQLGYAATTTSYSAQIRIGKNGTNATLINICTKSGTSSTSMFCNVEGVLTLNAGDTIELDAYQDSGGALALAGGIIGHILSIDKVGDNSTIAQADTDAFFATGSSQSIPNGSSTTLVNPTVVYDKTGSYNSSNGFFTAKSPGIYDCTCGADWESLGANHEGMIGYTGSASGLMDICTRFVTAASTSIWTSSCTTHPRMLAGQTVACVVLQNSGVSAALNNSSRTFFTCARVGNY